uniref:W2 domain-containing protein n=1 Tax=Timspurckia oligopyrenoides TaxID=708627 RepID=A0A7S0ZIY8_9RHOD|mmetsp:Transcript_7076/g.12709  ORF Transcript_7076/g.12709 Transcript_7076/m.12709 type:complete len:462 (+) Transcript_7076:395-1780(+)|eukprot:CAMPEP_0182441390 /NCGR_PEP_ID=MMETSP1172-20130603/351_1 /TAXON_ID=708627 /ORGANISM="Timspurckia oligopyrenoides, Strain CCMP3278" /LENGTH=461 /DNA_ID=CAMNT_0024635633 /DNA_START=378 /DNA_END=1763 /DNA_ORIENTATION=-
MAEISFGNAYVNIGGVEDDHYRYVMPVLIPKVEGRGNGIKTRIVNCVEIGKKLNRPPGYLCKFFGCELGAQTMINDKEGTYIVNGAFEQKTLSELVDKFIKLFVTCENCKLPETDLKVSRSGTIKQKCLACGHSFSVDMMHKLTNYIINNPPDSYGTKSSAVDKQERRRKKAAAGNGQADEDDGERKSKKKSSSRKKKEDGEDSSKARKKSSKKKKGDGENAGDGNDEDEDNIVWSTDTSKDAMAARLAEAGLDAKLLDLDLGDNGVDLNGDGGSNENEDEDDDDEDEEEVKQLKELIASGTKSRTVGKTALELAATLLGKDAEAEDITVRATELVVDAYITVDAANNAVELITGLVPALKAVKSSSSELAQAQICNRMDRLCESLEDDDDSDDKDDDKDYQIVAQILKGLFDNEIITESVVMEWYEKECYSDAMSAARKAAAPVVQWIQDADEDDDDDEE